MGWLPNMKIRLYTLLFACISLIICIMLPERDFWRMWLALSIVYFLWMVCDQLSRRNN